MTNEVLHNRTTLHFDWKDRLRILFGKVVHSDVDIELAQPEVTVVKSTSRVWVERIIPPRYSGGYAIEPRRGDKFSNELTDAQAERLALLLEEMGEAQQAIGKILRHGYHSWNPDKFAAENGPYNIHDLEKELGDVTYAIEFLCSSGDLNYQAIQRRSSEKCEKVKPYLHHQS